ncbi:MAG: GNAT family N-acetyltransferase [Boseongicola sp.]
MPEIEIIPAPIALKGRITELCCETYEAHRKEQPYSWPKNFFDLAIKPVLDADFSDKKGNPADESRTVFVAMIDRTLAGYIRLSGWSKGLGGEVNSGNINDIFVLPDFRSYGVAKALIEHAKLIAKKHDWDTLDATVAEWNIPSTKLFEQARFALKSRDYRFGPDRQAADFSKPQPSPYLSPKDWFWIALSAFNVLILLMVLSR